MYMDTSPYDIELFIENREIRGSVGGHPWNRYLNRVRLEFIDYVKSPYANDGFL